jgi:hypothetical protein
VVAALVWYGLGAYRGTHRSIERLWLPELDEGETACIRLALVHPGASLLLMDERAGRAIAADNGLQVAGTAAVIGMARLKGLIPSAKDVFAHLHASDFRISAAVIRTILERVGEG